MISVAMTGDLLNIEGNCLNLDPRIAVIVITGNDNKIVVCEKCTAKCNSINDVLNVVSIDRASDGLICRYKSIFVILHGLRHFHSHISTFSLTEIR